MGKHTITWQCPKCKRRQVTHIDPQYMHPPECEDYPAHHSKRSFTMVRTER